MAGNHHNQRQTTVGERRAKAMFSAMAVAMTCGTLGYFLFQKDPWWLGAAMVGALLGWRIGWNDILRTEPLPMNSQRKVQ